MQLLQQKRNILLVMLLVIATPLICRPLYAETTSHESPGTQKTLNLSGLYLGFFPCDDCKGVRTTLALNKNNTYVLMRIYVGKSEREFVEKGSFAMGDNGERIVLTPRKGGVDKQEFLIDDNMLIKLDEEGNRITSDGADRYILHRKDVVAKPENQHASH